MSIPSVEQAWQQLLSLATNSLFSTAASRFVLIYTLNHLSRLTNHPVFSQITIRTVEGGRESGTPKIISPPYPNCDLIFPATLGHLLCKCDDRIVLFDCAQRLAVSEVIAPATKYVSWSSDGRHVALMSPHAVVICNKKLEVLASLAEARVKSGTWDDDGIFIFTTVNHVKYVLTSGDSGILRSIDTTHYAAAATGGKLHSLDRDVFVHNMQLDLTEAHFKRALAAGRQDDIVRLVKSNKLVGQAIIGHLYRCGRPEVALHFVNEPSTRFELSLQCGNLSAAQECAEQLDRPDCWRRLAAESMRHGDFDRAETCCTKTKDFERLALMYTVTGNSEKLRRLSKIAEVRGDGGQRMHVAMLLGDVLEKIAVLRSAGLDALAYASAFKHGQSDLAASILAELKEKDPEAAAAVEQEVLQSGPGTLLLPPPPISCEGNWPRLEVQEGNWSAVLANAIQNKGSANDDLDEELDAEAGAGWGDDDLLGGGDKDSDGDAFRDAALDDDELDGGDAGGGWGIDELDLPESPGQGQAFAGAKGSKSSAFLPPSPGDSAVAMWLSSANAAGAALDMRDLHFFVLLLVTQNAHRCCTSLTRLPQATWLLLPTWLGWLAL
jgi:coatomer subunit alpha